MFLHNIAPDKQNTIIQPQKCSSLRFKVNECESLFVFCHLLQHKAEKSSVCWSHISVVSNDDDDAEKKLLTIILPQGKMMVMVAQFVSVRKYKKQSTLLHPALSLPALLHYAPPHSAQHFRPFSCYQVTINKKLLISKCVSKI